MGCEIETPIQGKWNGESVNREKARPALPQSRSSSEGKGRERTVAQNLQGASDARLAGIAAGPVSDDDLPASGDALWYLVRPRNCAGAGTYDSNGPAQAAPRDAEIAASPAACPD